MNNNQLKRKPYFDPYIYQKVLEDVFLSPIAKELLFPWNVKNKHKFLFAVTKERFYSSSLKEKNLIESVVDEELDYQLKKLMDYIGSGEEEKQQWFESLREEFNLPSDYKFE